MSVPKLRFKEFDDEWENACLVDLSIDKSLNNGVFNDQNKVGKGYKLINVLDMYIERDIDENRLSLLDLEKKEFERNQVKFGDIFFTRSSLVKEGIAFSNVYLGNSNDITYDGHLIKLSPDLNTINPIFLNYVLKTGQVRKQLIQGGKTATMTTIGQKEVGSSKVDFPSKSEQTKIASFLSAVDEKISQLTQKHELLSQYKQGMMQKLFSQQIRFKADDGKFVAWGEKNIGEVGEVITGKTPSTSDADAWNGDILFVTPTDMNGNKYQLSTARTVSNNQSKLLPKNTIMFTCIASIGKMSLSIKPCITNQQINSIIVKIDNPEFIYYQLLNMVDYIKSTQANTTLPIINKTEFSKFVLQIPQYTEQTKIANFLSSIDQKIEVVAQQIEQAKQWKKGLLQQMFV